MATPQLSPGVLTREVDLTVGRAENVLDNIGAIAGPFPIGPIDDPIDINITVRDDIIEKGEDTMTFLGNYIDQIETELDKKKLKEYAKTLYTEVSE